jgi:phage/plasmid primase-like uncharacterized protein
MAEIPPSIHLRESLLDIARTVHEKLSESEEREKMIIQRELALKNEKEELKREEVNMREKLKKMESEFEEKCREREQQLAQREEKMKKMSDEMDENAAKAKSKITLDVGETKFVTTKTTLMLVKDSYFVSMLRSGHFQVSSILNDFS